MSKQSKEDRDDAMYVAAADHTLALQVCHLLGQILYADKTKKKAYLACEAVLKETNKNLKKLQRS